MKQIQTEVKHDCLTCFGLLHPHLLLETKGIIAALRGREGTKVLNTSPSHWELMYSELSDFFSLQVSLLIVLPNKVMITLIDTCC